MGSKPCIVGGEACNYKKISYDYDGWAEAAKFLPASFDLCCLMTNEGKRNGWWNGTEWDGLRLKKSNEIIYWKKNGGV